MTLASQHSTRRWGRAAIVACLTFGLFVSACASDGTNADGDGGTDRTTTTAAVDGGDGSEGDDTTTTTTTATGSESTENAAQPMSIWGIEAGNYDLVALDLASGDITLRIPGWGADAVSGDQEGGAQALQQITAEGGNVWVADCCEPAVGSVFRVDPTTATPVPEAAIRANGTSPVLSPDGTRLAVSVLDIGVAVHDAATGEMLIGPELIGSIVSPPAGTEAPFFATPIAWIDGDTVAVAVNGDEESTVTMASITQTSAPSVVGPVIEVPGTIIAGATRSDGALVVAVESTAGADVAGQVYSTDSGALDAEFALDPATLAIDYDASGTFLLVSRENLPPSLQGLGETGELGDVALVFAAWNE